MFEEKFKYYTLICIFMQRNSLLIAVVGIIVVVIAVIGFLFFMHTSPVTPTSTPTSISKPSTPTPTTSTSTSMLTISSSNIMTVTVKNISACVHDECQEFCVCIEMHNPFSHNITITPGDFKLVTTSGDYTPAIIPSSTPLAITLHPGCEINLTYQFHIPNSVKPEEIVFSCPSGIKSCVPFPKPIAYLSLIHLEYTTNDTELKIYACCNLPQYIKVWSGQNISVLLRICSSHKSLPVVIEGIESASFIKLNQTELIPPGGMSHVLLILQGPCESYYGAINVKLLALINGSWLNITKAIPICAKALAEENHLQGYTYILYNFTLTYYGPCYFIPLACDFVLKTNDGIFRGCLVYTGLSDCLHSEKIYEGVTTSGLVGFKVPENAIPEEIYYEDAAGVKILSLTTTQPKLYYSIISRVNIMNITNYTNICIKIYCINTRGISGEVSYFTLCIANNNGVPFPLANITISPLSSIANYKNMIVPAYTKYTLKIGFEFPNFSYYGPLNITIYSGTPHFITITINNYTIDKADAEFIGRQGYEYVLFNVSVAYYGPGKFCFSPYLFHIITSVGKFGYCKDCEVKFNYLYSEVLYNGTIIHGYISFLIPCTAEPLKIVYIEGGVIQGEANITLSPNYISRIQYISLSYTCNKSISLNAWILGYYYLHNGHLSGYCRTRLERYCKTFMSGNILNITILVCSHCRVKYLNFTITNITVNSPFIVLKICKNLYYKCFTFGCYYIFEVLSLIVKVPNESYLGNISITVYVHLDSSNNSADLGSIQHYSHEYHNRVMLQANEYPLLLLKDEINRLLRE